jgi:ketosteroid isomerase-like protein
MAISREEAVALLARLADAVNRHDKETILSYYADDATVISPAFREMHGKHAIATSWDTMFTTFPDWSVSGLDVLVDGDRVMAMAFNSFTDRKGWFGLPPTGERVTYRNLLLFTVVDGKVAREERLYDISAVIGTLEKLRLEQELKTAAVVQGALLSRRLRTGRFYEAIGDSAPCRSIGGDFFELMEMPSGNLAVALGDVSGKGPAAALLGAMIQGMLAAEAQAQASPATVMARLNRALLGRGLGSQYATLVYGVLSPDGKFTYCNAGHNAPILFSNGRPIRLNTGGMVVGGFPEARFEEEGVQLQDGEVVCFFSDGLTEARNREDEEFGEDRLLSCLTKQQTNSVPGLVKSVLLEVHRFSGEAQQSDDITLVAMRFRAG